MRWTTPRRGGSEPDDDATRSTVVSIANDKLVPPTPNGGNLFSRAFGSLFGTYTQSSEPVPSDQEQQEQQHQEQEYLKDYVEPLNQSMRSFESYLPSSNLGDKRVRWGLKSSLGEFYDSDDEINETVNSIRNITVEDSRLPGTYPEVFNTPYIPRNYKIDQDSSDDREMLNNFLKQTMETNKFLEELLTVQQYEKVNRKDQTTHFIALKKELAAELETSKQVYEGFRRLLTKYRQLKQAQKAAETGVRSGPGNQGKDDLKTQLEVARRSLQAKTERVETLQRDLKRLSDQRDDLKTTILEYKGQNLRLKTTNELLQKDNENLEKKLDADNSATILQQRNEMLEFQITKANEMFKSQAQKFKEQIFDLQTELEREKKSHELDNYAKDRRIQELEQMVSLKRDSSVSPVRKAPVNASSRSRPASYHEPSTRILSPIRANVLDHRAPKQRSSRFRSELLKDLSEAPKRFSDDENSISDLSAFLNNSEDLTGLDNDRVAARLLNKPSLRPSSVDLSAIFSPSRP